MQAEEQQNIFLILMVFEQVFRVHKQEIILLLILTYISKYLQMSAEHFKYPQCQKGDCHVGEVLNLVCIEPQCIQKSVICGICYDEQHKSHKIKPLKVIINHSKKYLEQITPMSLSIDVDKVKSSINDTKKNLLTTFEEFQKHVIDKLANIKSSINAIFIKVVDQIDLKTGKSQDLLKALNQIKSKEMQHQNFIALMQKLLAGVPLQTEEEEAEISGKQIEDAVIRIQSKVQKDLKVKEGKIKAELQSLMAVLQKTADNPSIFDTKIQYKFSNELKHGGVSVIADNLIKSTEGYNYHFGLMEPSIQQKGNRPFKVAFKIKQNISNWLAVGICYKNTIAANSYNFNYSTLGHGAYLVSSNGGSWSSIDSSKNNTVTAFNYYKGDIVTVEYDPTEMKAIFRKKNTEQSYTMQFEAKDDDQLHLCGLFYYNNDEIEYLGYDQE